MKARKHQHALQIVQAGLDRRLTENVRYLRLEDCVTFNNTGGTPMQLIQVPSVSLTAGVPYDSTIVEYWKYHGVIKY